MKKISILFLIFTLALVSCAPIKPVVTWDSTWESGACGHLSFKNTLGVKATQFHFTAHLCQEIEVTSLWSGDKTDMGVVSTPTGPVRKWRLTSASWWNLNAGATDLQTVGFCLKHPLGITISDLNAKIGVELLAASTTAPQCGNGVCDAGEDKDNCSVDCENLLCSIKIVWDSLWGVGRCGHVEFQNTMKVPATGFIFNSHICAIGDSDMTALWTGDAKKLGVDTGAIKWRMSSAGWWSLPAGASDTSTIGFCIRHPMDKWTKDNMRVWLQLCYGDSCNGQCGNGVCDSGETVSSCPQDCLTSSWCSLLSREMTKETTTSQMITTVVPKETKDDGKTNLLLLLIVIGIFLLLALVTVISIVTLKRMHSKGGPVRIEKMMTTSENLTEKV